MYYRSNGFSKLYLSHIDHVTTKRNCLPGWIRVHKAFYPGVFLTGWLFDWVAFWPASLFTNRLFTWCLNTVWLFSKFYLSAGKQKVHLLGTSSVPVGWCLLSFKRISRNHWVSDIVGRAKCWIRVPNNRIRLQANPVPLVGIVLFLPSARYLKILLCPVCLPIKLFN